MLLTVYALWLSLVIALLRLPYGSSKTLAEPATVLGVTEALSSNSSTATTSDIKQNKTDIATVLPTTSKKVHHLRRKRELQVDIPYDFHISHMPCDVDVHNLMRIIQTFPSQCIWVVNNRYLTENFYRTFKLYQLEGHFFGQYAQRLKRFEMDPHDFHLQ